LMTISSCKSRVLMAARAGPRTEAVLLIEGDQPLGVVPPIEVEQPLGVVLLIEVAQPLEAARLSEVEQ